MELRLEANKAYHEIEIFDGKTKIGEAEIKEPELVFTRKTPPIWYLCPTCLSKLDDWLKEKRCPDCGQKLKWERE